MVSGTALVRAHLDSFMDGRLKDFDWQLATSFRYKYLPPVMGSGPAQARRWRKILFSIYRDWSYQISDEREDKDGVALRVAFIGVDPVEPHDTATCFYDTCVLKYELAGSRISGCDATYLPFGATFGDREAPPLS